MVVAGIRECKGNNGLGSKIGEWCLVSKVGGEA